MPEETHQNNAQDHPPFQNQIPTLLLKLSYLNFTKPDERRISLPEPHASDIMNLLAFKEIALG
jgi:hypothetical protein